MQKKRTTIRYFAGVSVGIFLGVQASLLLGPSIAGIIGVSAMATFVFLNFWLIRIKND